MKWIGRMENRLLTLFLFLLFQPGPKAFGQLSPDEERSQCELSLENRVILEDHSWKSSPEGNYLLRHLPDTDKQLTEERERELIYIYQNEKNPNIKQKVLIELLSSHINLIKKLAYKTARSWEREDFAEDLIQDAILRLAQYLNRHDSEKSRVNSYILSYMPKTMRKKLARYISPVLVSDRYREEIEETEEIMMPIASELTTYKPKEGDNIDESSIEDTQSKPVESWAKMNQNINQIENFILRIGGTPRERYILRHRIFTFEPEPAPSITEKFKVHSSGVAIRIEEKKLMQKISNHLNNGSSMGQDQIFTEISKIIEEGNSFPTVTKNKMDWQTEDLIKQIKYLIQEMDNTQEERHTLKDQQAKKIAKEVKLDKINQYILRHRLMEKPHSRQTLKSIGERFGSTTNAIASREQTILRRLANNQFSSPELQEIAERIAPNSNKTNGYIAQNLARQMGINEVKQHILRYRLMEKPHNRQTLKSIGEQFNIPLRTITSWQTKILKKLRETKWTSVKLKKTAERILLEEEQRKKSTAIVANNSELDRKAEWIAKQVEDFILEMGNNPLEIYILRHRIFTLHPESSYSAAKKFETNKQYILNKEGQLLKTINEFLNFGADRDKRQIFKEVINRIRRREFFIFVNNSEINPRLQNLIRQAGLNEIEAYILKYRFLAESGKRKTESAIGELFGINRSAVHRTGKSILKKLEALEYMSPELKEIVEKINQEIQQKKRPVPIINIEQFTKEWDNLPQEWKENEVYQYIFEYRLLINDPKDRKTLAEIAEMLNVSKFITQRREKAILTALQERGLVSFQ